MPEVKEVALASGIPVYQPLKIKEEYQEIIALEPDLIITAAYGQIVPEAVLNAPKIGCINVHASLLPKYRGGAPVHYAIMEGEEVTGVTIMYMVKKWMLEILFLKSKCQLEQRKQQENYMSV